MVQHSALCLGQIAMSSTSKPSVSGGEVIRGFSSSCQRPPVPGEEDDRCQSDAAAAAKKPATRFNGLIENLSTSERLNQLNIRSLVSQRQQTSLSVSGGGRGHSVTKLDCCRDSPPLGFEPEGSACASPRFKENSSSASSTAGGAASYLRWAESLKLLLQDSEGVRLFKLFLEQEQGCSAALDFWFACTGLKMVADDQDHVASLAKMIYRRYVKGDRLRLTADVRRRVVEKLRQHQIDPTMFDEAQAEVEYTMRCDDYPLFLKSDTYLQYVQSGSDSPHTGNCNTSSSKDANANADRTNLNDSAPAVDCIVRALPTLAEDEELATDDIRHATVASSLSLTPSALFATRRSREAVASSSYAGISFPKCSYAKLTNPYHISYAPVSAQDSELQSLSSDALTDDTMSYTDSSVDGRERAVYTSRRKQLKAIRRNADVNQQTDLNQPLIPRTERVPPDCNLAESDPKKFASLLAEKLQRVKEEQDKLERMTTSLRSIDAMDVSCIAEMSLRSAAGNNALNNSVDSFPYTSMLLRSVLTDRDGDDNAQSILEEHVSRVWENSNGPTPGGIHSPGIRTPNHHHVPGRTGGQGTNLSGFSSKGAASVGAAVSKSAVHHRVRDDVGQTSSMPFHEDRLSYMVASQLPATRHSHRHPVGAASVTQSAIPRDSRQTRASISRTDIVTNAVVEVDSKRPSARRSLEPAILSNAARPNVQDPLGAHVPEVTNERVMMWMLENEKYSSGGKPRCSTDGSDRGSSHKRSSHKSSGSGSGRKGTQQPVSQPQHRANRSESLDRSRATSLAHNVSMPFHQRSATHDLPPPQQNVSYAAEDVRHLNTTTTSATSALLKSKSSAGNNPLLMSTSLRDGHLMPPPQSMSSAIPTSRGPQGYDSLPLSSSCEDLSLCVGRPERKLVKKPASKNTEFTVVGYYFCDEPVPYRTTIPGHSVTLGQFKQHIAKKGNYRYFFKTVCDEFESGVVNEEVTSDGEVLPLWEGKVVGKVERI